MLRQRNLYGIHHIHRPPSIEIENSKISSDSGEQFSKDSDHHPGVCFRCLHPAVTNKVWCDRIESWFSGEDFVFPHNATEAMRATWWSWSSESSSLTTWSHLLLQAPQTWRTNNHQLQWMQRTSLLTGWYISSPLPGVTLAHWALHLAHRYITEYFFTSVTGLTIGPSANNTLLFINCLKDRQVNLILILIILLIFIIVILIVFTLTHLNCCPLPRPARPLNTFRCRANDLLLLIRAPSLFVFLKTSPTFLCLSM